MTERLSNKNPCNSCVADRQIGNPNRWECECDRCSKPYEWKNDCIKKLAEYETAEEEGKLVILPCKPGDTVYIIREDCDFSHDCYQSRTCNKCEYRSLYVDEEVFSLVDIVKNIRLFGITIFLIHEKAEKALEEMNKDE